MNELFSSFAAKDLILIIVTLTANFATLKFKIDNVHREQKRIESDFNDFKKEIKYEFGNFNNKMKEQYNELIAFQNNQEQRITKLEITAAKVDTKLEYIIKLLEKKN